MGNTIKNYEKKRRKEKKEAYARIRQIVHGAMLESFNLPNDFKEKEAEIFNQLNEIL